MLTQILTITALLSKPGAAQPTFAVVAPKAWESTIAPFVAARESELHVAFIALESVLSSAPGVDAPEKLKRALYELWRTAELRYVLLVGDADTIPVRFMVLDRTTAPAFDYAFYPSDLYYADLANDRGEFDDWNASKEGFHANYFGEVRGETNKHDPINFDSISYTPEVAVGRWPVSTARELEEVIAKTLAWKPLGEHPRAVFIHAEGWVDARDRVGSDADRVAQHGFEVSREFFGSGDDSPTPARVERALLAGTDFAFHVGHGSEETWHACLGPKERDALADAHAAVFFSVGCSTGHFCNEPPYQSYLDVRGVAHIGTNAGEVFHEPPPAPAPLQTGETNSTGLGERLIRMPKGGAVVYIGCATGAQPCALSLLDGFTDALASGEARVGDAWRRSLADYVRREHLADLRPNEDWYPPSIFFQGMKFMFFGDPTLRVAPAVTAH